MGPCHGAGSMCEGERRLALAHPLPPCISAPQHPPPSLPSTIPIPQGYVDVATLGVLCSNTCGSLHHWCPWSPALDGDEFFNDLRWSLVRPQVRRCSSPVFGCGFVMRLQAAGALWVESSAVWLEALCHGKCVCGLFTCCRSPLCRAWRLWAACAAVAGWRWRSTSAPSTGVVCSSGPWCCTDYDSTASPMTAPVPELLCRPLASGRRVETDLNFPALSCDHAFAAKLMYEVSWASA